MVTQSRAGDFTRAGRIEPDPFDNQFCAIQVATISDSVLLIFGGEAALTFKTHTPPHAPISPTTALHSLALRWPW